MKRKQRRLTMYAASFGITVIMSLMFAFAWYSYYNQEIIAPFYRKGNWLVIFIYVFLIYVFFKVYGGFKYGFLTTSNIIYSQSISIFIVNVITYLQIALIGRAFLNPGVLMIVTLIQIIIIMGYAVVINKVYYAIYPPRKMIVVYGSSLKDSLIGKISMRKEKYRVCASISSYEDMDVIFERISHYEAVILCDVKSETRNKILKYCFDQSIRAYITPKLSDIIMRGADEINLFDTPLLLCRNRGLNFEQRLLKRIVDLLVSAVAIVVFSPFMIVTAVCIKAYDKGPVLYKQKRSTIGGRIFEIYKFRSMVVDAEKDGKAVLASRHDDRITPIGKFIRRYRIDELPQLFNIFMGDMSIVGPRPERPEIGEEYAKVMPEFRYRLKVKAGLTGYAQVIGKYDTTAYDKLKMDMMYIENYSFFLDVKLILMTVKTMFQKESSQGVEKKEEKEELKRQEEE